MSDVGGKVGTVVPTVDIFPDVGSSSFASENSVNILSPHRAWIGLKFATRIWSSSSPNGLIEL